MQVPAPIGPAFVQQGGHYGMHDNVDTHAALLQVLAALSAAPQTAGMPATQATGVSSYAFASAYQPQPAANNGGAGGAALDAAAPMGVGGQLTPITPVPQHISPLGAEQLGPLGSSNAMPGSTGWGHNPVDLERALWTHQVPGSGISNGTATSQPRAQFQGPQSSLFQPLTAAGESGGPSGVQFIMPAPGEGPAGNNAAPPATSGPIPLWSAADVFPATLGLGGLPAMLASLAAPGMAPPPPMPLPQGQQGGAPLGEQDEQQRGSSRAPRRKRARIMREGQLTMILYGANEALLWTRRVAAFQHTMRGVLGDRRLTFNWGGSVLDSVVGVFLTQNVADHLSSRAYMELASRFPPPRRQRQLAAAGAGSNAIGSAPTSSDGDASTGPAAHSNATSTAAAAANEGDGSDGGWTSCEDSVDWEAVRTSSHEALSDAIKCRGMQFRLAVQIKDFLNQIRQHNLARLRKQRREDERQAQQQAEAEVGASVGALPSSSAAGQEFGGLPAEAAAGSACEAAAGLDGSPTAPRGPDKPSIAISGSPGDSGSPRRRRHITLEYEDVAPVPAGEQQKAAQPELPLVQNPLAMAAAVAGEGVAGTSSKTNGQAGKEGCPPAAGSADAARREPSAAELLSLEWLRDAPDDVARNYLMNINGLGRKSVGCIMLLTLGKKEFPVDTNVGRICARLGWIPLESEQAVEDLDDYAPEPEVHAYLHSRLLGFSTEALYELHYQMITLGKVFCNKQQPNCKACPLHDECEYAQNNGPSLHGRKRMRQPAPMVGDGMAPPVLPSGDRRRFFAGGGSPSDGDGEGEGVGGGPGGGSAHSSSISGGSSSGEDSEEEEEDDEEESSEPLGPSLLTRRQAAAKAGGWHGSARPAVARRLAAEFMEVLDDEEEGDGPPMKPTLRQVFAAAMAEASSRGLRLHWRTLERLTRMHEEELREAMIAQTLDLDDLVAATPRRPRTPGLRCPAGRFERTRRLKRNRELQQLLAEADEDEVERLLELGTAGTAGPAGSRRGVAGAGAGAARVTRQGGGPASPGSRTVAVDRRGAAPAAIEGAAEERGQAEMEAEPANLQGQAEEGQIKQHDMDKGDEQQPSPSARAELRLVGGKVAPEDSTDLLQKNCHPAAHHASTDGNSMGDGCTGIAALSDSQWGEPWAAVYAEAAGKADLEAEGQGQGTKRELEGPQPDKFAPVSTDVVGEEVREAEEKEAAGVAASAHEEPGDAAEAEEEGAAAASLQPAAKAAAPALIFSNSHQACCIGPAAVADDGAVAVMSESRAEQLEALAVPSATQAAATASATAGARAGAANKAQVPLHDGAPARIAGAFDGATPIVSLSAALAELAVRGVNVGQVLVQLAPSRQAGGQLEQVQQQTLGLGLAADLPEAEGCSSLPAAPISAPVSAPQQPVQRSEDGTSSGPAGTPDPKDAAAGAAVHDGLATDSGTGGDSAAARGEGELGEEEDTGEKEEGQQQEAAADMGPAEGPAIMGLERLEGSLEDPIAAVAVDGSAIDAALECERLAAAGHELAEAQRSMLVAEGKGPGTDLSPFKLRLVEVSLRILGLEATLSPETAQATLAAAKRVYRKLSILVHPDRCTHPAAQDAFAAASQAMHVLVERAEALESNETTTDSALPSEGVGGSGAGSNTNADSGGCGLAAGAGEGGSFTGTTALVTYQDAEELLKQVVWNQNRLAVQAVLLPPGELLQRGLLHPAYQHQFAPGSSLEAEPLLFLPASAIPTLKKRRRHAAPATVVAAATATVARTAVAQTPTAAAAPAFVQPEPAAPADAAPTADLDDSDGPPPTGVGPSADKAQPGDPGLACVMDCQADAEPVLEALEVPHHAQAAGTVCGDAEWVPAEQGIAAAKVASVVAAPAAIELAACQPQLEAAAPPESSQALHQALGELVGFQRKAPQQQEVGQQQVEQQQEQEQKAQVPLPGEAEAAGVEAGEEEDMVAGLLLLSARTALSGRFPLNGTYFQVNEVFADFDSSQSPIQLPRRLVDSCKSCSVHFGHSIHFMCKGMSQAEVAHMFGQGFVCFRAFQAATGAPMLLPDFLQPSIPTKSSTPWKNKEQRAAARAAKEARIQGLPPPMPEPHVRWVRVPVDGEAVLQLPAVLPPGQQERQPWVLEEYGPNAPAPSGGGLAGLGSPTKRKQGPWGSGSGQKKQRQPEKGDEGSEGAEGAAEQGHAWNVPHSQEARDAKSGKGRKRLFLHPIIRTRDRCGTCPACRNLHWKKACMTRRAEQEGSGL